MNSVESVVEQRPSVIEVGLFNAVASLADTRSFLGRACLFLFIALCPVEDFMLQGTPLRSLGACISIFPLCVLAFIKGVEWLLSERIWIGRGAVICFVYVFLTATYGLLLFGMWSQGLNLIWKSFTSLVSLLAVVVAAQLDYCDSRVVRAGIYCALLLVVMGFLFGNSNPVGFPALGENGVLHFTPLPDVRPRGLSSEPSGFSITAVIVGLLSIYVTRSRSWKTVLCLLTIGLLIASGSKGGILTLFLCVVVLCVMKWHSRWYQVAALLLGLLPVGLVLVLLLPTLFPEDSFALSGTIPTRFSMLICSLMTVAHHPFGVGLTGFLPAIAKYLPGAMSKLEAIFPFPLYFGEVSEYLTSADMVSTKTFFFDQLIRFGIPFGFVFVIFIGSLLKRLAVVKQTILLVAVLASAIAVTTYVPGTGNFAIPIVFGIALSEVKSGSRPCRSE
jgi:hypothetical protein